MIATCRKLSCRTYRTLAAISVVGYTMKPQCAATLPNQLSISAWSSRQTARARARAITRTEKTQAISAARALSKTKDPSDKPPPEPAYRPDDIVWWQDANGDWYWRNNNTRSAWQFCRTVHWNTVFALCHWSIVIAPISNAKWCIDIEPNMFRFAALHLQHTHM